VSDENVTSSLVKTILDRVESVVNATRSEMLTLRAGFKEFSRSHKEPA
jgi:hypothetical protein